MPPMPPISSGKSLPPSAAKRPHVDGQGVSAPADDLGVRRLGKKTCQVGIDIPASNVPSICVFLENMLDIKDEKAMVKQLDKRIRAKLGSPAGCSQVGIPGPQRQTPRAHVGGTSWPAENGTTSATDGWP